MSKPIIGIVDYAMGNLRSVQKAVERVASAVDCRIVSSPEELMPCHALILPGVGSFGDGMEHLHQRDLVRAIQDFAEAGKPLLGVCLGMQLLFDSSTEAQGQPGGKNSQAVEGLKLIPGTVVEIAPTRNGQPVKVPHMGWNALQWEGSSNDILLSALEPGCWVYFVHGYHALPDSADHVLATADYAGAITAVVRHRNVWGTQFHPEKSQDTGLAMLRGFASIVSGGVPA